jgi:hypothetical protein
MPKTSREKWVVQREFLLRVNYAAILLCSATSIKLGLEGDFSTYFYAGIAFSVLLFVNAKALKKR